jgi:hypothetical protein
MNFQFLLEKLEASDEFKHFIEDNPKAYLYAGFFVLDFIKGNNEYQVDFFVPENEKIATFYLKEKIELRISDEPLKEKPLEISKEFNVDFEGLIKLLDDIMIENEIKENIEKAIVVLQKNKEGKEILTINITTPSLAIITIRLDASTYELIDFKKSSLFDFVKRIK